MSKHNCPDCRCEETACDGPHCPHGAGDGTEFCCRCDYRHSLEAGWIGMSDAAAWPPPGCKLNILVS